MHIFELPWDGKRVGAEKAVMDWFHKCMSSWFSTSRSSDTMMRGTSSEAISILSLASNESVRMLYEVGLFVKKDEKRFSVSPDGIVFIDCMPVTDATNWTPRLVVQSSMKKVTLFPVEVRSLTSEDRLSSVLHAHVVGIKIFEATSTIVK